MSAVRSIYFGKEGRKQSVLRFSLLITALGKNYSTFTTSFFSELQCTHPIRTVLTETHGQFSERFAAREGGEEGKGPFCSIKNIDNKNIFGTLETVKKGT